MRTGPEGTSGDSGGILTRSSRGGVAWATRATAKDVAALAQVSAQTVSRVANGADNVRPETRERVLEAMAKIGYAPNAAARALRSGGSTTIGLVAHHLSRTGEAHIVEAVAAVAEKHGYSVALAAAPDGSAAALNQAIRRLQQGMAGVVVLGLETTDLDRLDVPARLPVVIADSRASQWPSVGFDQAGGAQLAVAHLLSLGHRTVHLVGGPRESVQAQQREQGWRAALEAAGRPVPPVEYGDWTPGSGYAAGRRLAEMAELSAVFVANDEMAAGLLRALYEAGRRIPHDVSVVGFDDLLAEYLWPPMTSVHQDFTRIGEALVQLLIAHMPSDDPRATLPADLPRVIPARLELRASSGPAPA